MLFGTQVGRTWCSALHFICLPCSQGKAGGYNEEHRSMAGGQRQQLPVARITWACTSGRVKSGIPVWPIFPSKSQLLSVPSFTFLISNSSFVQSRSCSQMWARSTTFSPVVLWTNPAAFLQHSMAVGLSWSKCPWRPGCKLPRGAPPLSSFPSLAAICCHKQTVSCPWSVHLPLADSHQFPPDDRPTASQLGPADAQLWSPSTAGGFLGSGILIRLCTWKSSRKVWECECIIYLSLMHWPCHNHSQS